MHSPIALGVSNIIAQKSTLDVVNWNKLTYIISFFIELVVFGKKKFSNRYRNGSVH